MMRVFLLCIAAGFALDSRIMPKSKIVFWHLEKAGGSSVQKILRLLQEKKEIKGFEVVREHSFFTPHYLSEEYFRIGVMREACSYLTSVFNWANARRRGYMYQSMTRDGSASIIFNQSQTPAINFKNWLYSIHNASIPRCGLLSMRYWTQVVNPDAGRLINFHHTKDISRKINHNLAHFRCTLYDQERHRHISDVLSCPCPLAKCGSAATDQQHLQCRKEIVEKKPKIDCWIRTEFAGSDTMKCIHRFRQNTSPVLNFSSSLRFRVNANLEHTAISCQEAFSDPQLVNLVQRHDGILTQHFGWSNGNSCCLPQSDPHLPVSFIP